MKKSIVLITCLLLLCSMIFNLSGCVLSVSAQNLMDGIYPRTVGLRCELGLYSAEVSDFAVRLFKSSCGEGNTLISPISVLCALAMTQNGAEGQTKTEMEEVLGLSTEALNLYLYSYLTSLPQGQKYKLSIANSLWFTDSSKFVANEDFLGENADFYGADIYKAPFDSRTLKDINNWVKKETDGMIPKILDSIPPQAVMYLINALAFEAEWADIYEKSQVRDGRFKKEDGTQKDVKFMYSTEHRYLDDGSATGFIKYYSENKYAFVALLPNGGVLLSDYITSLDGSSLNELISSAEGRSVITSIPKFETEYEVEMSEILKGMGIIDAFDEDRADFSGLGTSSEGNIYISRVIHKTSIKVGERGTKAGAATVVEMVDKSSSPLDEIKEVNLDRPFVYMLIDCESNIPFFIGTVTDVNN